MSVRKMSVVTAAIFFVGAAVFIGCDGKPDNYNSRTVVYVSNINDGLPYLCDVLNQGDSLYYEDTFVYKLEDDYITEDRVKITIHNRPYNGLIEPLLSLGDFLLTGYSVEFTPTDGSGIVPVTSFTGQTSVLVPSDQEVEAYIVLVPFNNKTIDPLLSMQYTNQEIYTNARIVFTGHEVQTDREITFEAGLHVNFADPLLTKNNKDDF
jgi:hypothetical protein